MTNALHLQTLDMCSYLNMRTKVSVTTEAIHHAHSLMTTIQELYTLYEHHSQLAAALYQQFH